MTKIAVLVGSLREDSLNKKLAHNLEELAPEGTEFSYIDLHLPLYDGDMEADFPAEVTAQKKVLEEADGVLIITPEYNRSLPGVLKNAMDWLSRPWGHNSFDKKPLGLAGASNGAVGTAVAQSDLRHITGYLNMRLMGQPELYVNFADKKFDEHGKVTDDAREQFAGYIAAFVEFVTKSNA